VTELLAGRYRIDGLLGRGGMSEVYHGYDERLKVLRPAPVHDIHSDAADAFRYLAMGMPRTTPTKLPKIEYGPTGIV
jgi:serine/threonine protein kinase